MKSPAELAQEICDATRGVDWSGERAGIAVNSLLQYREASPSALAEALDVLIDRLESWQMEDNDGVAHVAITAGSLVERGGSPERLGDVLLTKLPGVLAGARRCADRCFAGFPHFDTPDDEADYLEPLWADALVQVDDRPITEAMIRAALEHDRTGATALAYLQQWTLPTVAAISRSARLLARVSEHHELLALTAPLRHSTAGWLYDLFRTELDAEWLVLCPIEKRGFVLRVNGASSNFNLHEIVSDVLIRQGIQGRRNPPEFIAYLRGEFKEPPVASVVGSFNFYDYRAASADLANANAVNTDYWVWNEGSTSDIPTSQGRKVLLAGPPAYDRSWNPGRRFDALPISAKFDRELSCSEFRATLKRLVDSK